MPVDNVIQVCADDALNVHCVACNDKLEKEDFAAMTRIPGEQGFSVFCRDCWKVMIEAAAIGMGIRGGIIVGIS